MGQNATDEYVGPLILEADDIPPLRPFPASLDTPATGVPELTPAVALREAVDTPLTLDSPSVPGGSFAPGGPGAPGGVAGARRGRHFAEPHDPEPLPETDPQADPAVAEPDAEPDPQPAADEEPADPADPDPAADERPEPAPESAIIDGIPALLAAPVPALPAAPISALPAAPISALLPAAPISALPAAPSAEDPGGAGEWVDTRTGYLAIPRDLVVQAAPLAQAWLDTAAAFEPEEPAYVVHRGRLGRAALTARDAEYACRYRVAVMYGTDGPSLKVRSVQTEAGQATVHLAEPDGSSTYHMTVEQVPGGVRVTRCRQVVG